MYAKRRDYELADKALKQMSDMEESLINAWADAWYRSSVGYFTRADARAKAKEKFIKEIQRFDAQEMEDYKVLISEGLEQLDK